jgi:predicted small lipoprotein YifL
MKAVLTVVMASLLLAGCGKKGAPSAPGPANEIIYPKSYPSR